MKAVGAAIDVVAPNHWDTSDSSSVRPLVTPKRSPWGPNVAVSAPRPPVRRCQRGRQTEEQDVEAAVELRGAVVIGQI